MAKLKIQAPIAFPQVFEAKGFADSKPSFSGVALVPKNDPQFDLVKKALLEVAVEKWGPEKGPATLKQLQAANKVFVTDGDSKSEYAGFEGTFAVNARSYKRPTVVDRDKTPLTEADGKIYAGAICNFVLDVWAQDNQYGKRVNCSLLGLQFVKDGEAFSGGRVAANDDFDDLSASDDADDFL